MTKHSETDMTKSTGTAYRPLPNQPPPIIFQRQTAVVIVDEIASLTPEQWASLGVKIVTANPNRVRCPLCRRVNTVSLVSVNAGKPSDFRCSYDGCRGYEWSE